MVVARQLDVALDVRPVHRDAPALADVARQGRAAAIHGVREPAGLCDEALVLDADGATVPVAGVPGDVLLLDHLRDLPIGRPDDVVGADLGGAVLEPRDGAAVGALRDVDDDGVDAAAAALCVGVVGAGDPAVGDVGVGARGLLERAQGGGRQQDVAVRRVLVDAVPEREARAFGQRDGGRVGGACARDGVDPLIERHRVVGVAAQVVGDQRSEAASVGGEIGGDRLGGCVEQARGAVEGGRVELEEAAPLGLAVPVRQPRLAPGGGDQQADGDVELVGGGLQGGVDGTAAAQRRLEDGGGVGGLLVAAARSERERRGEGDEESGEPVQCGHDQTSDVGRLRDTVHGGCHAPRVRCARFGPKRRPGGPRPRCLTAGCVGPSGPGGRRSGPEDVGRGWAGYRPPGPGVLRGQRPCPKRSADAAPAICQVASLDPPSGRGGAG